jgi:DNA-binding MarR family transcriptional regulator
MAANRDERLREICRKVSDTCLGARVRRAARAVGNHYDEHLKPSGLKGTQFTLLTALYLNPEATISRMAEFLLLDRTTLNRNLKPLEREGLIASGSGKDLRTRTLKLTDKGIDVLQQALPLWLDAQSAAVECVKGRVRGLVDDLGNLENLGESSPA